MSQALTTLTLLAATLLASHSQAHAEQTARGSHWGIGLAAGAERKPYRAFDDDPFTVPLLVYENRYLSLAGATLDAKLPPAGALSFRLRARFLSDGYEAEDSPYLSGMAERNGGLWVGGAAIWQGRLLNASVEALSAVGDAEGKRTRLELNRSVKFGALTLTPRVAAAWYDAEYVDYYYGVRAGEARAGRAGYAGKSATNTELGLRLGYAVAPHHNVFADLSATGLGSAIKDSPLVERSRASRITLGYLYSY